jgi:hypothetical protein
VNFKSENIDPNHIYFHGHDASICSCNCPRKAQFWYYSTSRRLRLTFIFGRCDLHNERDYVGEHHDIEGEFIPNDSISMTEEELTVILVMQS